MSIVLTHELEPGIVQVTMNRPDRLNALSQTLIVELHTAFDQIGRNRDTRVVILTGAGRGFCSGADLKGGDGEGGAPGTEGMNEVPRSTSRRITWPRCMSAFMSCASR